MCGGRVQDRAKWMTYLSTDMALTVQAAKKEEICS